MSASGGRGEGGGGGGGGGEGQERERTKNVEEFFYFKGFFDCIMQKRKASIRTEMFGVGFNQNKDEIPTGSITWNLCLKQKAEEEEEEEEEKKKLIRGHTCAALH